MITTKGKIQNWLVSLMMVLALGLAAFGGATFFANRGEAQANITGMGTISSPYILSSVQNIRDMAANVNGNLAPPTGGAAWRTASYALGANINWSGADHEPIGTNGQRFAGNFDGRGFTIDGLTVGSHAHAGFFGYVQGATINNVWLTNVTVINTNASGHTGGLAAFVDSSTFSHCFATGSVSSTTNNRFSSYTAGLIGYTMGTTVRNCYFNGHVTHTSIFTDPAFDDFIDVGGVVGNLVTSQLINSYALGTINTNTASSRAVVRIGGVAGANGNGSTISNCVALNTKVGNNVFPVVGTENVGRIAHAANGSFANSHANTNMLNAAGNQNWNNKGLSSRDGADISLTDAQASGFWSTTLGYDADDWNIVAGSYPTLKMLDLLGTITGAGTVANPYLLHTAGDIRIMSSNVNSGDDHWRKATYRLENSITWTGAAHVPIGSGWTNAFEGNFNGQGHTISGLTVVPSGRTRYGFFGETSGARIYNLGINANMVITHTSNPTSSGVLVGSADNGTIIRNSWTTGTLTNQGTPSNTAGGIVGSLGWQSLIQNSFSSVNVTTSGAASGNSSNTMSAGGIAGGIGGVIEFSYASGDVTAPGIGTGYQHTISGGIAGQGSGASGSAIRNSVALNANVRASSASTIRFGRVAGSYGPTSGEVLNIRANDDMRNASGANTWNSAPPFSQDGTNVSLATARTVAFWQTTMNFSTINWNIVAGSFPTPRVITPDFPVPPAINLNTTTITVNPSSYTHTGSIITPTVLSNGTPLVLDTDFTINRTSANNTDNGTSTGTQPGVVTFSITGINGYEGTVTGLTYTITGTPALSAQGTFTYTHGQALSAHTASGTASGNGLTGIPGTWAWVDATAVPTVTTNTAQIRFTPTHTAVWGGARDFTVNITVNPTNLNFTQSGTVTYTYGQAYNSQSIAGSVTSATTGLAVEGSWAFADPTTIPTVGTTTTTATFTPTDTAVKP
jgi:hypothetical protein